MSDIRDIGFARKALVFALEQRNCINLYLGFAKRRYLFDEDVQWMADKHEGVAFMLLSDKRCEGLTNRLSVASLHQQKLFFGIWFFTGKGYMKKATATWVRKSTR